MQTDMSAGKPSFIKKTLRILLPVLVIFNAALTVGQAKGENQVHDDPSGQPGLLLPEVPVYEEMLPQQGAAAQKIKQSQYLKENLYKQVKKTTPERTPPRASSRLASAPGVFNIRRSGEGYDIDVQMDVRDLNNENLYFRMDLPNGEAEEVKEEPGPPPEEEVSKTPPEQAPPAAGPEGQAADAESQINLSNKHMLYAQTYLVEGKTDRAMFEVDRSLKAAPNSALALALKGSIYFRMGEIDLARAFWKKAYKIDPTIDNLKESLDMIGGE